MNKNTFIILMFRLIYWALWLSFILVLIKWSNNYNNLWWLLVAYFTTPTIDRDNENNKDDSDIVDMD